MKPLQRRVPVRLAASVLSLLGITIAVPAVAVDYGSSYPTELQGVLALSPTDAWTVGYASDGQQALIYHWDGKAWTRLSAPTGNGSLYGIAGSSANDVWAVGGYSVPRAHSLQTLTLHWNGSGWSRVASPSPSSLFNPLLDVSALSASDAWAVGYFVNASDTSKHHALALHWNGAKWSRVAVPGHELYGVAATSASNVWAVGLHVILRWNGTKWLTQYSNPGVRIFDVSALSPHNAWAVGDLAKLHDAKDTVVLHWNGRKWSRVPSPNPTFYNSLADVHAISPDDVWAVGCHGASDTCTAADTLILHWNGTKWSKVASPHPSSHGNRLGGTSGETSNDAWAVGGSAGTNGTTPLLLHWNGSGWTAVPLKP